VGRKKKLPVIENLEILDIGAEGMSIGKVDNMVVFIPGMIPGDIVDVQINKKRRKFMSGYALRIIKESGQRTTPFCQHFGVCGGCKWQNLPYEKQLFYKQKQVSDNLERIGKVFLSDIRPIIGSDKQRYYRNKLEFTFSETRWLSNKEIKSGEAIENRRALGFHIPGKFDRVLDIQECFLQDDLSNKIRNSIREYTFNKGLEYYNQSTNTGFLRNLIIRNTELSEWMVILVFKHDDSPAIKEILEYITQKFPEITSLSYVINPKSNDTINDLDIQLFSGRDHIFEMVGKLRFKIGAKSFFQTNSTQVRELYKIALDFASLTGNEVVYDLYTGTGTIACYIADRCKEVIGLEYVEVAVEDAKINASINEISNVRFFAGDMKNVFNSEFIEVNGKPDVIITDPPRAGMHPDVVQAILNASPSRIVYVSCNPATQARDINLLDEKYKVTAIQPVDMFPHTHHVENVVCLERK
jgi:23S rRNA (uracil1939-C5)-methyltransferase